MEGAAPWGRMRPPEVGMKDATAKDVMNPDVLAVRVDLTVPELSAFFSENQITGAPVIDRQGHLVGVVSRSDIAESNGEHVRDIMTPAVYTVPEETPVTRIARTMIAGRIHRLFVTRKKRVVGIVTSLDLLKLLCQDG